MKTHQFLSLTAGAAVLSLGAAAAQAVPVALTNAGGEVYADALVDSRVLYIPTEGIDPLSETGWQASMDAADRASVQALDNTANSGVVRLSAGGASDHPGPTEEWILFQETSYTPAAGDVLTLDFFGRGFFQYDAGTDVQTSLFGYLDDSGNLVQVKTQEHPSVVGDAWTDVVDHVFTVPATGLGSELIGQNLVIGFFTDTPDVDVEPLPGALEDAAFTSVDDVTLSVVPIPEPASLALLGLGGLGLLARRRRA